MIISRFSICFFWVGCLLIGIYEIFSTHNFEVGVVYIYMSIMGLLRESSFNKEKPEPLTCDARDFIQTGKY